MIHDRPISIDEAKIFVARDRIRQIVAELQLEETTLEQVSKLIAEAERIEISIDNLS